MSIGVNEYEVDALGIYEHISYGNGNKVIAIDGSKEGHYQSILL